jgi:hypothetical protein
MLAGIVLQLGKHSRVRDFQIHHLIPCIVIILAYAGLATEFFLRYARDRPFTSSREFAEKSRPEMDLRLKIMSYALGFSTICLFIRYVMEVFWSSFPSYWLSISGVYRVVELADGWNGRIISTQVYFSMSPFFSRFLRGF